MCVDLLQGMDTQQLEWVSGIMLSEKKTISKGHILYDSIDIAFLKWQNYKDGKLEVTVG